MVGLEVADIAARVGAHEPRLYRGSARWQAATALVLHQADVPAILFIERAQREGDPWSGDMALPGGRRHAEDPDLATTAARETFEEVGLRLDPPVGRLDDQGGRVHPGTVATFVHVVDDPPDPLILDPREVQTAVWIPVPALLDRNAATHHRWLMVGRWPAVRYERYTIWGLTHRIVQHFFEVVGAELPTP